MEMKVVKIVHKEIRQSVSGGKNGKVKEIQQKGGRVSKVLGLNLMKLFLR